jgi:hypothetical protein
MGLADIAARLAAYENEELSYDEEVELFQELLDTDVIYHLQGSYGRRMQELIEEGKVRVAGGS